MVDISRVWTAASSPASGVQIVDRIIRANPTLWARATAEVDMGTEPGSDAYQAICMDAEATVSVALATPCPQGLVDERVSLIRKWRFRLAELIANPGITQRTPEWYAARRDLVTASDIGSALGSAKYGTQKQFLVKKCGEECEQAAFSGSAPPLKWGIMFEPVANTLYCTRLGTIVHEFGLLRHPTVPFLGASPDGISESGVLLEIKCPFSRKIDGTVPAAYYHQIQGQLDVCGMDDCDYMECEFKEHDRDAAGFETAANEMGTIVERWDGDAGVHVYDYGPVGGASSDDVRARFAWTEEALGRMRSVIGVELSTVVVRHWSLCKLNIVRVHRDPAFVADMIRSLGDVWDRVLGYRADREAYNREVRVGMGRGANAGTNAGAGAAVSKTRYLPAASGKLEGYSFQDDDDN